MRPTPLAPHHLLVAFSFLDLLSAFPHVTRSITAPALPRIGFSLSPPTRTSPCAPSCFVLRGILCAAAQRIRAGLHMFRPHTASPL